MLKRWYGQVHGLKAKNQKADTTANQRAMMCRFFVFSPTYLIQTGSRPKWKSTSDKASKT